MTGSAVPIPNSAGRRKRGWAFSARGRRLPKNSAAEAGVEKSVASKHLSLLKEAGLVDAMRIGTQIRYSLTVPCVLDLASCAERCVLTNRKKSLGIDPGRDEPHDADDGSGVPITGKPL